MRFVTNNIDSRSIEWELTMLLNIRVLRLRSTNWKSSFKFQYIRLRNVFKVCYFEIYR